MVKVTAAMVNSIRREPWSNGASNGQDAACRHSQIFSRFFASHEESIPTHSGDSWNTSMDPATSSYIQDLSALNSTNRGLPSDNLAQLVLHVHQIEERMTHFRPERRQNIHISVRSEIVTEHGAEQRESAYPVFPAERGDLVPGNRQARTHWIRGSPKAIVGFRRARTPASTARTGSHVAPPSEPAFRPGRAPAPL